MEQESTLTEIKVPYYLDILDELKDNNYIPYEQFITNVGECPNIEESFQNVEEVEGNLFLSDSSWALAHCVSEDFAMFKGIAAEFKRQFANVEFLRSQQKKVNQVAVLQHVDGRFIFYLITKQRYFQKPNYHNIYATLENLKNICIILNIDKIAMPTMGCGLDRLDYSRVKHLICQIFQNSGINIRIYKLVPANCVSSKSK